jgi:hypothetical protein
VKVEDTAMKRESSFATGCFYGVLMSIPLWLIILWGVKNGFYHKHQYRILRKNPASCFIAGFFLVEKGKKLEKI